MHTLGHWFKYAHKGSKCELCGLEVVFRHGINDTELIGHQLAVAGECPIKDREEILKWLGIEEERQ